MTAPPNLVWDKALELLSCVESALAEYDAPACRTFVAPGGSPSWDVCCDCGTGDGQAWVAISQVYPTDNFPTAQTGGMRCLPSGFGAQLAVGILRCAAVVDDQGRAPSSERLTADAWKVQRDRQIVERALRCCYFADADPGTFTIGSWTPLGPQGGCVGGLTTLQVSVSACACPPAPVNGFGLEEFGTSPFGSPL